MVVEKEYLIQEKKKMLSIYFFIFLFIFLFFFCNFFFFLSLLIKKLH